MPTHRNQGILGGTYFCTATCWDRLPLIDRTGPYDHLYKWMHLVTNKGCSILGYVIMPNHLHLLIHLPEGQAINTLMANMKRFAAYEMVQRLVSRADHELLAHLKAGITSGDLARQQQHRVWRTSSDIKPCDSERFMLQKLEYMHANPITGEWTLAESAEDYLHSSARFYNTGEKQHAPIVHFHSILFGAEEDGASGSLRRP